MKRFVRRLGCAVSVLASAAILAGCVKTDEEEAMVRILEGTPNEVTILVGVKADPNGPARQYCALYGRRAFFRDAEPVGDAWESYTTGSRPYLYYFDCL